MLVRLWIGADIEKVVISLLVQLDAFQQAGEM